MTPERWSKIESLFLEAIDRAPAERAAFLESIRADDETLYRQVQSLLVHYEAEPAFLETSFVGLEVRPVEAETATVEDGRIGPYRLVRTLGRGGMGTVYLAERVDGQFDQQVAIKVLRRGLDTDDVLRRFLAERHVMASLQHPHIARIFDGGTTDDGRPYFVMEYVDGIPLTAYCDAHRLSVDVRVRLFRQVCTAVQAAHRNLIIHRDLKSSNILVAEGDDGVPQVKLLDFGIAKLLEPNRAGHVVPRTRTERRLLTPAYASPEQVKGTSLTTASDVYALGIVLYELLTGRRPYSVPSGSWTAVERVVCETRPESPSTTVTRPYELTSRDGTTEAVSVERVSRMRGTSPERLRRRLGGDLDNIVLKALRKEPDERYASVEQLSDDLQCFLDGQPVSARNATLLYRARKFVERHRTGVALAALVGVLLMGLTTVTLWQSFRLRARAAEVEKERDRAETATEFLVDLFRSSDPSESRGEDVTARELMSRGTERIETELADEPALQAEMMGVLSEVYESLGNLAEAERLARQALARQRAIHGSEHPSVATALNALGWILHRSGQSEVADSLLQRALALRRRLPGASHLDVARTLNDLAVVKQARGEYGATSALLKEALAIRRTQLGEDHESVGVTLNNLAALYWQQGKYDEAERYFRETLSVLRNRLGRKHPRVAIALNNLAVLVQTQGKYDAAETLYREVLALRRKLHGDEHPNIAVTLYTLGNVLYTKGSYAAAESHLREALAMDRKLRGDDHPSVAFTQVLLAGVLADKGAAAEADRLSRDALAKTRQVRGEEHVDVANALLTRADVLLVTNPSDSGALYREARDLYVDLLGPDHPRVAWAQTRLATWQHRQGRHGEALARYRKSLATLRDALPAGHPHIATTRAGLGRELVEQGAPREAEPLLREARANLRRTLGASHWRVAAVKSVLGRCLTALGRYDEAEPLLTEAHLTLTARRGPQHVLTRAARQALADWHEAQGLPTADRAF